MLGGFNSDTIDDINASDELENENDIETNSKTLGFYVGLLDRNAKKFKEYIMPSGEIRKVQGYEPFALELIEKFKSNINIYINMCAVS